MRASSEQTKSNKKIAVAIPMHKINNNEYITLKIFSWRNKTASIGGIIDKKEHLIEGYCREWNEETGYPILSSMPDSVSFQFNQNITSKNNPFTLSILSHDLSLSDIEQLITMDWTGITEYNNQIVRRVESYGNIWEHSNAKCVIKLLSVEESHIHAMSHPEQWINNVDPGIYCPRGICNGMETKMVSINFILGYCCLDENRIVRSSWKHINVGLSSTLCIPYSASLQKPSIWKIIVPLSDWNHDPKRTLIDALLTLLNQSTVGKHTTNDIIQSKRKRLWATLKTNLNKWKLNTLPISEHKFQCYEESSHTHASITTNERDLFEQTIAIMNSCWDKFPLCPLYTPLTIPVLFENYSPFIRHHPEQNRTIKKFGRFKKRVEPIRCEGRLSHLLSPTSQVMLEQERIEIVFLLESSNMVKHKEFTKDYLNHSNFQ